MASSRRSIKWILAMSIVMAVCLAAAFILVRLGQAREDVRLILCVHNLKLMGLSLEQYAKEHGGAYPQRISELAPYLPGLEVLVCPEARRQFEKKHSIPYPLSERSSPEEIDALSSYAMVPGLSVQSPPDTVAVYEKNDHLPGRGYGLLYRDGHAAWEPPEKWEGGPPNPNLPRKAVARGEE